MEVINLPESPDPSWMGIELISNANVMTSALGADDQERQRKGSRYALTFSLPLMPYVQSMEWDDLNAEGAMVRMRVFQPGFDVGAPGSPRVDGGPYAGVYLPVGGLNPGYTVRKGQFLNTISFGRVFLYRAAADATADENGKATVKLRTMLRLPPQPNDRVEIAAPMIEGYARDVEGFDVGADHLVALRFTVRER